MKTNLPRVLFLVFYWLGTAQSTLAPSFLVSDAIEDTQCTSRQLEEANDSQLHVILKELKQTAFFRNFVVDLQSECPLKAREVEVVPEEAYDEEPACEGHLEDLEPEAGPACALAEEDPFGGAFGGGGGMSSGMSSSSGGFPSSPPQSQFKNTASPPDTPEPPQVKAESISEKESTEPTKSEDEFECNGGDDLDKDEDAEPLCHLAEEESETPLADFMMAAALEAIKFLGFESDAQRQTFDWSDETDPISAQEDECITDDASYWNDMCTGIQLGESGKVVNLALNPERNTGYDGAEIWKAIYEENCLSQGDECYEERVLHKLLSGLHTSTTLSIATHYYPPSKRKNRTEWESNPTFFMDKFKDHADYLRHLHFSYVVLLRALRKASPYLYEYPISTGHMVEDQTAQILLRRLLDSAILKSCESVFDGFNEKLMFAGTNTQNELVELKSNFKGVFQNVSSILDCVQCQQCKLHGKLAMLGYGTALKILLSEDMDIPLERNEVVALVQTVAKFSESLREVRQLTNEFWEAQAGGSQLPQISDGSASLVDQAIGLAAELSSRGKISSEQESTMIELAFAEDSKLLSLVKHYGADLNKFLQFSSSMIGAAVDDSPDAIIVGSGLAGLAAAVNILDRGGRVVIVEKEHRLGGNSNKASSGINACCPQNATYGDILDSFRNDTIKSAGSAARPDLIDVLVEKSGDAISFLTERVGVDLSLLAQLGGHSHKRTHRPSNGMAGAEIIYGMQKVVKQYEKEGMAEILVDTKVSELVTVDDKVVGVKYTSTLNDDAPIELRASNVVLATGGFASDRRSGSYLDQYRPELMNMPATAGPFSTGDGIAMATTLGAGTVNMDKVQLHPTGWVDPEDPDNASKTLAAELMRGVGGILLNDDGKRFANELGTRAYVTDQMLSHNEEYRRTGVWDKSTPVPSFSLVLSSSAAADGKKHVDLYSHKGLLTRLEGIESLAEWSGLPVETLRASLSEYQKDAKKGIDQWGKTSFRGVPDEDLENEIFFAGRVTPVLHYCMGGLTIDTEGNVLTEEGKMIDGLHAAGEVTGGVHGNNRLGGNSLLECTVFGTIVGKRLPIQKRSVTNAPSLNIESSATAPKEKRDIPVDELERHGDQEDCWVAIGGVVYDMTDFAEEHPAGPASIHELCGRDGTSAFEAVHNAKILDDFEDEVQGTLVEPVRKVKGKRGQQEAVNFVSMEEVGRHSDEEDLWTVLHGTAYDLTTFEHPGGPGSIRKLAGIDGSKIFDRRHSKDKLPMIEDLKVGSIEA